MPVIAESPRVGHGFPSTLIAGPAHDQAALNILPQEGLLAGPVMSFNVLLQSENFEMIKRDVRDLSSLTGRFPEYTSMLASPVQEGDLASLLRLSGNIITSLDKIAHLRRDRNDANDAADTGEKRTHSDAGDYKTKRLPPEQQDLAYDIKALAGQVGRTVAALEVELIQS
ncbi:hypothetical protein NM208_g5924 [Fusarium decemcellulare]|uniref:Uncharacterized protein n=1 Tax=Fusarium decemcellulare TaxID=57161 RepID=A0ACC1SF33_9HYPO|nr:hypothetical protein NM208_g5924 [Fusarium decemcellulare]